MKQKYMRKGQLCVHFCTNRHGVFLFGHYCKKLGYHASIHLLCGMVATIFLSSQMKSLGTVQITQNVLDYWKSLGEIETAQYQGLEGYFSLVLNPGKSNASEWEKLRKDGASVMSKLPKKVTEIQLVNVDWDAPKALAFAEGLILADYRFDKYLTSNEKRTALQVTLLGAGSELLAEVEIIANAVKSARNWVNEPVNALNAQGLGEVFAEMGKTLGFKVEVFGEAQIESLKMGGLLAVNKGSQEPPTFSVLEYKPSGAKNQQPIVLVGKGVVFDTGGLSLKPTPNSMDMMKCDMGGAAVVGGVFEAIAKLQWPIWLVGLVPSTDNRPGEMATCPGDIITMYDGTTVEVLNTDAEGRLILADALSFAKKYEPQLVIDYATLTGAAARALGTYGSALMSQAPDSVVKSLKKAGENTYERLAELPLWEEYYEEIKGGIADLKNLGKGEGGAQSAAMFLRHFTSYPWAHIDIAGTAFATSASHYTPKGGTGVGVRLTLEFLRQYIHG
ncbi:MAG: leucyl aminopeptidase [Sphingomonadales bacterium]|nr:leucyl aminopeptidase [Sphingomonadales bacterium]